MAVKNGVGRGQGRSWAPLKPSTCCTGAQSNRWEHPLRVHAHSTQHQHPTDPHGQELSGAGLWHHGTPGKEKAAERSKQEKKGRDQGGKSGPQPSRGWDQPQTRGRHLPPAALHCHRTSRSCIPPAGPSSSTSHGLPSSSPVLPHIPPSPVQLRLPHSLSVPHSGRTTDPVSSAACLPCPHPFSALRGSTHPHPAPGTPPTTALLPEVLAALGRAGEAPWHMAAPEQLGLEEAPHQHGDQEPPVL